MQINIVGYAMIILLLIVAIRIYRESDFIHLKCIISDVDGKRYCVRERNKLDDGKSEDTVKVIIKYSS